MPCYHEKALLEKFLDFMESIGYRAMMPCIFDDIVLAFVYFLPRNIDFQILFQNIRCG